MILFRLQDMRADELATLLIKRFDRLVEPLKEGALVVFEESSLRIRRLPLFPKGKS